MRSLVLIALLVVSLMSAGKYLSPLPLPKTYFIDLDIDPCSRSCLRELLANEEYLSFMAKVSPQDIRYFKEEYQRLASLLNAHSIIPTSRVRIALVYHTRLRKYANNALKALTAYLLQSQRNFSIDARSYDKDEGLYDILQEHDADLVILLMSYAKSYLLDEIPTTKPIFIPTLYKYYTALDNSMLYFGGADYPAQARALEELAPRPKTLFYLKNSYLSKKITEEFNQSAPARLYAVDKSVQNLSRYLRSNRSLNETAAVFNTPPVKTALILTQMRLYKIRPAQKLSTQINYNPRLFHLTQTKDRAGLLIATNFSKAPADIYAAALAFDEDLAYEWIGYSSCIGMESLLDMPKSFSQDFVDNQLRFETNIKEVKAFSFEEYRRAPENREGF